MAERSNDDLLVASITLCVPCFVISVEVFLWLHETYPAVYKANEAKIRAFLDRSKTNSSAELSTKTDLQSNQQLIWHERPVNSHKSAFNLLKTVWKMSFEEIEDLAGFDASVFCNVLWNQMRLFMFLSIPLGILLIPVYATAMGEKPDDERDNIDMMSLTNIRALKFDYEGADDQDKWKAWRLWLTCVVASSSFLGCAWFLKRSFRVLSMRADRYNSKRTEARHVVLITKLLRKYQTANALWKYLNTLFPGDVASVRICKNLDEIQPLWEELEAAKRERELCTLKPNSKLGYCCWKRGLKQCQEREKLASDAFYSTKEEDIHDVPAGVVMFRSMKSALVCSTMTLSADGQRMKVRRMPESREEVLWGNIGKSDKVKLGGRSLGYGIYMTTFLLFSTIIAAIQGLVNLSSLEKLFAGKLVLKNKVLRASLQGAIPPAVTGAVFALLPWFFHRLSKLHFKQFRCDEIDLSLRRYADTLIRAGLLVVFFSSSLMSITEFKIETL